jgi:hypothetical protein
MALIKAIIIKFIVSQSQQDAGRRVIIVIIPVIKTKLLLKTIQRPTRKKLSNTIFTTTNCFLNWRLIAV